MKAEVVDYLVFKAYLNPSVRKKINKIRNQFGIPPDGFLDEPSYLDWLDDLMRGKNPAGPINHYQRYVAEMAKKFLPEEAMAALENVVERNFRMIKSFSWGREHSSVGLKSPKANFAGDVEVVITPYATQPEVIAFIKEAWSTINEIQEDSRKVVFGTRPTKVNLPLYLEVYEQKHFQRKTFRQILEDLKTKGYNNLDVEKLRALWHQRIKPLIG